MMSRLKLFLFIVLTLVVVVPISASSWLTAPKIVYQFDSIKLPDGTPCTVVRGGNFSGMIGVTCNYTKKNKEGE